MVDGILISGKPPNMYTVLWNCNAAPLFKYNKERHGRFIIIIMWPHLEEQGMPPPTMLAAAARRAGQLELMFMTPQVWEWSGYSILL